MTLLLFNNLSLGLIALYQKLLLLALFFVLVCGDGTMKESRVVLGFLLASKGSIVSFLSLCVNKRKTKER